MGEDARLAGTHSADDRDPPRRLGELLAELGTLCRTELRIGRPGHTFTRLTNPTDLQATALELLGINPATENLIPADALGNSASATGRVIVPWREAHKRPLP